MNQIKKFQCNIKPDKIYLTLFKDIKDGCGRDRLDYGYIHRRYRRGKNIKFGYFDINDNYIAETESSEYFDDYPEYIRDFLEYNFNEIDIYEFNSLKEANNFLNQHRMLKELKK